MSNSELTPIIPEAHRDWRPGGINGLLFKHALELHRSLWSKYADSHGLEGPDQYPFTRQAWHLLPFYPLYHVLSGMGILSYPRYRHVQAQAYWILANLFFHRELRSQVFLDLAASAGDYLVQTQRPDGPWLYDVPGHSGSTVYSTWAALSLLKLNRYIGRKEYLQAALRWKDFLTTKVGTARALKGNSALEFVNYFNPPQSVIVLNASTLTLAFLSNLKSHLTKREWQLISNLIESISHLQMSSGEIAYSNRNTHYICAAYNAWEFIDLFEFARNVQSQRITDILHRIADYLTGQIQSNGLVNYDCNHRYPTYHYHTLAVACALHYAYLKFHEGSYLKARNLVLSRYFLTVSRLGVHEQAHFKVLFFELPYLSLFARQASYCLVCLLRIAIVNDVGFLGEALC